MTSILTPKMIEELELIDMNKEEIGKYLEREAIKKIS